MKRFVSVISVLMLSLCSGCGDTHESLAKEGQSTMKELIGVLDNVKDAESAKSNKAKLKSLMEKLNDINQRQAKLPAMTEAEMKSLEGKLGKDMEEDVQKFVGHMMRIGFDPAIRAELDDLDQTMKKVAK